MPLSRRALLAASTAGLGLLGRPSFPHSTIGGSPEQQDCSGLEREIQDLFLDLPDRKAFKIYVPATEDKTEFVAESHAAERLFSASANKVFILCERLRQLDSPTVEEQLVKHELTLGEKIWSLGSSVFNPPDLTGLVSERTTIEAMISHSDNTATDMMLKQAGPENVRQFIASLGLTSTMIPDSTRALTGYVFGATNYKTITWEELLRVVKGPLVHPLLNDVETFASSAHDLVSLYAHALQGTYFRNQETLHQFRRILSLGDITYIVPFPLGASVFGKAGYFDTTGQHGRCIAGGMYFSNRWVYFAMILNWDAPEAEDPKTVAAFMGAIRRSIVLIQDALG